MTLLKAIPFVFWFWATAALAQTTMQSQNLCFFSLNNSKEFELTRSFLDKANRSGGRKINVVEFHDPGEDANPESSFRKMIATHQACDGLVISGHHTGSFGGARAKGVLNISFLEELSCDPQYEAFFRQVKDVWLQGCRTLGVGLMEFESDDSGELQADYHMQRVGAELIQDGLEQSFADLSFEFSATLDQDNPLASRYLRVFPAANVFGWTKSSPGKNAGSENSLLYHMAHMVHLSWGTPMFNPLKNPPQQSMSNMSRSFSNILQGNSRYNSLAVDAWLSHGRVKNSGFGYDNPDLNAYPPLLDSSDENLLVAKAFACEVRNTQTFEQLQAALEPILLSQTYVAYNLNVIWDVSQRYSRQNSAQHDALRRQLVSSAPLMNQLNKKLKSPQTGLLMKIEYYNFYKELTGNRVGEAEALILRQVRYFMLATDLAGTRYDIRDFRESLLLSLASHHLAGPVFYRALIHAPETQSTTLYTLTWSFVKESPEGAGSLMGDIVNHPKADSGTLRGVTQWLLKYGEKPDFDVLQSIVENTAADEDTLVTVAFILARNDLADGGILAATIIAHPQAGSLALSQVSLAIRKHDIAVERGLLVDILSHPAVDKSGVQNVSRIIVGNKALGSSEILTSIVNHQQVDEQALSSVAIALGNHSFDAEPELLESIRNHPRAGVRTLKYVDQAMAEHNPLNQEDNFF
jgi:hypothetical protein